VVRFSPGCCWCEEADCEIGSDDFDASPTSVDWIQRGDSPDWSWSLGTLRTSTPDQQIIYDAEHPNGRAEHHAQVRMYVDYGSKARLMAAWDTEDDYLYAEVDVDVSGCGTFRIGEVSGGVDTVLDETCLGLIQPRALWHVVNLCFYQGRLLGTIFSIGVYDVLKVQAENASPASPGLKVGLATGDATDNEVQFDDFYWWTHESPSNPSCPSCGDPMSSCQIYGRAWFGVYGSYNNWPINCDWEEVAGTWNNQMTTTDSDALLIAKCPHPDGGTADQYVDTTNDLQNEGEQFRVIVDYLDEYNFHFAEFEVGPNLAQCALDGHLRIYKRSGGVDTLLDNKGLAWCDQGFFDTANLRAIVCFERDPSGDYITANGLRVATTGHDGARVGLGTGTITEDYTNVSFAFNFHENDVPDCFGCSECNECEACYRNCAPNELKIVATGGGGWTDYNCSYCDEEFGGTHYVQVYNDLSGSYPFCNYWNSEERSSPSSLYECHPCAPGAYFGRYCDHYTVDFIVDPSPTDPLPYKLRVHLYVMRSSTWQSVYKFQKGYADPIECTNLVDEQIPYVECVENSLGFGGGSRPCTADPCTPPAYVEVTSV